MLDLRIVHNRMGSSADPSLNGHLKRPNNLDQLLNDASADQVRKYRADYNNRPPSVVSFMTAIASTSTAYIVNLSEFYSYRLIGKLTDFLQLQEFSLRRHTQVTSSPFAARFSSRSYRAK